MKSKLKTLMIPRSDLFTFKYTKVMNDQWTWELYSNNGTLMAVSAQHFAKRWAARRSVTKFLTVKETGYIEVDLSTYDYPFTLGVEEK